MSQNVRFYKEVPIINHVSEIELFVDDQILDIAFGLGDDDRDNMGRLIGRHDHLEILVLSGVKKKTTLRKIYVYTHDIPNYGYQFKNGDIYDIPLPKIPEGYKLIYFGRDGDKHGWSKIYYFEMVKNDDYPNPNDVCLT